MELTPLRRTSSGAVLGGVCAALARRWQVDPTVLRIAMVLLALIGGLGVAFYVGALLLVPKDDAADLPLHRALPFTRGWSPAASIGAVVGLGVLITVLIGSWLPFGIAPAVGLGFLWYFGFYRRRGAAPPAVPMTDFERAAADWQQRVADEQRARAAPPQFPAYRATPQLEPPAAAGPVPPPPPRARRAGPRWLWPSVLCLVGAGLATMAVLSTFGLVVPAIAYAGTVLGALGLGLLVAAFAGRPRGLLPLGVLAGIVTVLMMLPAPSGEFGDDTFRYPAIGQLPDERTHGAGDVTLDLTAVSVTETRRFVFTNGVGDLTVKLPGTGNVVVQWKTGIGDYTGPDGVRDGLDLTGTYSRTPDASAPTLTLVVSTGVGDLRVEP